MPPAGGGGGRSKGVIAAIVLGVLLLVGGGVTAGILLLGGDDDGDEASDPDPTSQPVCSESDAPNCTPPTEPTDDPTDEPTEEPTEEPTDEPTEDPTEETTTAPVEGDPAAAVQGFIDAAKADDCQGAISYLTERLIKEQDANCKDFDAGGIEDIDYGTPVVVEASGTTATVEQEVSAPGQKRKVTLSYGLVYEDGHWMIDELGQATPDDGGQ
jgi:hypothetical protein